MTDFASTFRRQLTAYDKSLTFVANYSGLDRAYLSRLASGQKERPSPETIVRIWIALVADPELFKADPRMPFGLSELLEAAGYLAVARAS